MSLSVTEGAIVGAWQLLLLKGCCGGGQEGVGPPTKVLPNIILPLMEMDDVPPEKPLHGIAFPQGVPPLSISSYPPLLLPSSLLPFSPSTSSSSSQGRGAATQPG